MSPEGYTEDQLVEQPAIELFAELGWATVSASEESFGSAEPSPQPSPRGRGSWLGRETKSEVVLVPKLRCGAGAVESGTTCRRDQLRSR